MAKQTKEAVIKEPKAPKVKKQLPSSIISIERTHDISMLVDLYSAAESVAEMPTIGIYDDVCSTEKKRYYSVMIHSKYRLVYRYTSRTIYIVGIRSNLRKTKFT